MCAEFATGPSRKFKTFWKDTDSTSEMKRYLPPFFLLLGTLYFGYLYLQSPEDLSFLPGNSDGQISFAELQQMKQETALKMNLDRQRAELEKSLQRNQLNPGAREEGRFHETPLREMQDPRSAVLNRPSQTDNLTLDQRMDAFLASKEQYEMLESAQKEAYVEQFLIEARKMGFLVKISKDMQIESITKIENK